MPKHDPFLTSLLMEKVKLPPINENNIDLPDEMEDYKKLSNEEVLKNLDVQYTSMDELGELRRMINKCKKNISNYASDVYSLKSVVNDVNDKYKEIGYGVSDEIFYDIDRNFREYMPNGDKNLIFNYGEQTKNNGIRITHSANNEKYRLNKSKTLPGKKKT